MLTIQIVTYVSKKIVTFCFVTKSQQKYCTGKKNASVSIKLVLKSGFKLQSKIHINHVKLDQNALT